MIADPLTHDLTALADKLASIPRRAGVAFVTACARRLTAATQAKGINATLVLFAVDRLRECAVGCDIGDVAELEAQLLAAIPDEDDCADLSDLIYADAIACTIFALLYATGGNVQNAVLASLRAYEAADLCAGRAVQGAAFTQNIEDAILRHSWVQSELKRQQRDLDLLLMRPNDTETKHNLISRAAQEPVAG